MPINPNILLQGQVADIGQAVQQGMNAYNTFSQIKSRQEEEARKKALQPYQDAVMQNELMKMNITGEYMFGNQIKNDILQKDYGSISAKLAKAKFLSPETKMAIEEAVAAKDDLGLAEMLIASRNNYYDLNPSARPKAEGERNLTFKQDESGKWVGLDPVTGKKVADTGVTAPKQVREKLSAEIEDAARKNQMKDIAAAVEKGRADKVISEENYNKMQMLIATGDVATTASAMRTMLGLQQLSESQLVALDPTKEDVLVQWNKARKQALETGKNLADVSKEMYNSYGAATESLRLYTDAYNELKAGASTGYIANMFPSMRGPTVLLENARNALGLQVASTSKLQPISNSDLSIIMQTAIPTTASPEVLEVWLRNKIEATQRLLPVLEQGTAYFNRKDATYEGWINQWPKPDNLLDPTVNPNTPLLQPLIQTPGTSDVPVVPTGGRYTGFKIL